MKMCVDTNHGNNSYFEGRDYVRTPLWCARRSSWGRQDNCQDQGAILLARNTCRCRPVDPYMSRVCYKEILTSAESRTSTHHQRGVYPLQVVAVDILGPLTESDGGNSYILVAGDYFTKWMEVYAIPNMEAVTVARDQLHSDQGKQFESTVMREICNILGMKKTRTSPYHPQYDGLVERYNRTLLDMLATTTRNHAPI